MTLPSLALMMFAAVAADWSAPVHVLHEMQPCVTYRAKLDGEHLAVRAEIQPGWHTFSIDNEKRAAVKLAGKASQGIDQPTRITLKSGLELADGDWYQNAPKDFSKPELRWYSWGFEQQVVFVAKVKRTSGPAAAEIGIRGQACTDKTCKNIDVSLSLPVSKGAPSGPSTVDLKTLVKVLL